MHLVPREGRNDLRFGSSYDDVLRVLGSPDSETALHDFDSHPKGRRTLVYNDFSVTVASKLGVFGMSVHLSTDPLFLWDTCVNDLSVAEFETLLLNHGAHTETAPPTPYGATDVYSADYGILAYFGNDTMNHLELQLPNKCPTKY